MFVPQNQIVLEFVNQKLEEFLTWHNFPDGQERSSCVEKIDRIRWSVWDDRNESFYASEIEKQFFKFIIFLISDTRQVAINHVILKCNMLYVCYTLVHSSWKL